MANYASGRGITRLRVSGYKSIVDPTEISIQPLTVLAGPNSSGKSSIVQPLLLLKQTLDSPFDPGSLNIAGPNVQFTSTEQFFSHTQRASAKSLVIGIEKDGTTSTELKYERDAHETVRIVALKHKDDKSDYDFSENTSQRDLENQVMQDSMFLPILAMRNRSSPDEKSRDPIIIERNRSFLELRVPFSTGKLSSYLSAAPASSIAEEVSKIIHVPGLRGNPARTYRTSAVGDIYPGLFNDYIASLIHHWKRTKPDQIQKLGSNLRALGLTWKVDTRRVDDTRVEIRVGRLPKGARGGALDMVSIADVGFGVSQSLPVVVALLAAVPSQMVYVEQPELHLHPRAQVHLADLLVQAAKRGTRIVVETHSSLLLLGIQNAVAGGAIEPRDVALHWFTRRKLDGVTEVTSAVLDKQGAFGDWPVDFGLVDLEVQGNYLRKIEKIRSSSRN